MKIKIGAYEFLTKRKAEDYIRAILRRYSHNQVITGQDRDFAMALLMQHPRRSLIVDCGVADIFVQHLDSFGNERRFCVRRVDKSLRDFSWRNVLSPKTAKEQVVRVCRSMVREQIEAFRASAFNGLGALVCPVTGDSIYPTLCDVDHAKPKTFDWLVCQWVRSVGVDFGDIEVVHKRGYQQESQFADPWMAENWKEFHAESAVLRVVHPRANRSLLRRGK